MQNSSFRALPLALALLTPVAAWAQKADAALTAKANAIHNQAFVLDSHEDTPINLVKPGFDISKDHSAQEAQVDIPKMQRGGLDGAFWAVYMGQGPRTPEGNAAAKQEALLIFNAIRTTIQTHSAQLDLATTEEQALQIRRVGKRAVFIGMENGYPIGQDLGLLKSFYDLGVRYLTLCHSSNNDLCDSATDPNGPEHQGLSAFGKQAVVEMNRLGMLIDVSHASDSTFYDVLRLSKAPVIASHSSSRALAETPRNLSDDMLRALARNQGVVQVNLYSPYVKTELKTAERLNAEQAFFTKWKIKNFLNVYALPAAEQQQALAEEEQLNAKFPVALASVQDAVNQIDHIVKIAGIDHVGIGSDFDGGSRLAGLADVGELPNLTLELVKRGYSDKDIYKIWSGNFFRVLKAAEKLRAAAPVKK
ncbi:membrane dipeptidase [Hymenobacter aquaticus]|uniref:Membrane dipeptidase n=1 Tax=Hymenobacter aquaticus TaxID=1867101 RepID=A0A4Z0PXR1_9BACT|nr:dipeptidase [Hymenobacter aquaticus]TGE21711.1 membrane dipeptidase [Hymenobacter aquaticus]